MAVPPGIMTHKHKQILKDKRIELKDHMYVEEPFMSYFLKGRLLTEQMIASIMAEKTRQEQVIHFLDVLEHRGEPAFHRLIEALVETGQEHYARVLDPDLSCLPEKLTKAVDAADVNGDETINAIIKLLESKQLPTVVARNRTKPSSQRGDYKLSNSPGKRTARIVAFTDGLENKGLEKDIEVLERLFTSLHFDTAKIEAGDLEKLTAELQSVASSMKDPEAFILFVLRCPQELNGSVVKRFEKMFDGENCKALLGKPKLFFLQRLDEKNSIKTIVRGDVQSDGGNNEVKQKSTGVHPKSSQYTVTIYDTFSATEHSDVVYCLAHTFAYCAGSAHITDLLYKTISVVKEWRKKKVPELSKSGNNEMMYQYSSTSFTFYFEP